MSMPVKTIGLARAPTAVLQPETEVQSPREPVAFEKPALTKKEHNQRQGAWRARAYFDVLYPVEEDVIAQTGNDTQEVVGYQTLSTAPDYRLPLTWWFARKLTRARSLDALFSRPYAWTPERRRGRTSPGTPVVVRVDLYPYMLEALRKSATLLPAHLRLEYFTAPRSVDNPEHIVDTALLSDDHLQAVNLFVEAVRAVMQVLQFTDTIADPTTAATARSQFALTRVHQANLARRACTKLARWKFLPTFNQLSSVDRKSQPHVRAAVGLTALPPAAKRGGL